MGYNPRLDKAKDNKFFVELYPDSTTYDYLAILDYIQGFAVKFAFITHDSDFNEDGELKKSHIHCYFKTDSMHSRSRIAELLQISPNFVQYAISERSSVRYLLHLDNPEKFQYDSELISSNFDLLKYFVDSSQIEIMDAQKLIDFIASTKNCTLTELTIFALSNNCYSTLRKSSYLFCNLLKENRG